MASKTKYNIIVGAKLDPKTNISEQIQSAISKTTYKINIDTAHLKSQLDSVLSSMKINVGGGTGGGSGGITGGSDRPDSYYNSGGFTQTARGSAAIFSQEEIVHAKSVTKALDEQGETISKVVKGYDNAGNAIKQYYRVAKDESEVLVRSQKEEGTLANRNAETYQRLSNRLQTLSKNGQITTKQTKKLTEELNKANEITDEFDKQNRLKEVGQNISDASKHAMKFGDMLKTAYEKFAIWSIATVSWYSIVRAMKDVVKQTIELDTAFTRLQMITISSKEEVDKLKESYIALAKEMRVPLSQVTTAAEDWLRTGMDASEANEALRASVVLSTDAFMEGSDATKVLIATQKAYGYSTDELIGVVDKLTTLDAKAATTAQDLGEAIALSGASASAAGIDFDYYLGLLATTSEATQQSSSVIGNAWKTLTARLRKVGAGANLDDEGEDISDVDKVLKQYGINLREVSKGMTDMGAVIDTLGQKWQYLNGEQKAQIATAVAGTRQQNIFIAAMENYDRVLELTTEATNSAGSAMEKFNIYEESTQAKIDDLKTSWTALIVETLNSDTFEKLVEFGTALLDIGKKAGGLIPIFTELLGLIAAVRIGGVAGGVMGGVAIGGSLIAQGISLIKNKQESERQEQIEQMAKIQQESEAEQKKVQSLMEEYLRLNSVIGQVGEDKEKLIAISKELSEALGLESSSIEDGILRYEDALRAYGTKGINILKKEIEDTQKLLDEATENAQEEYEKNRKAFEIFFDIITLGTMIQEVSNWADSEISIENYSAGVSDLSDKLEKLKSDLQISTELSEDLFSYGIGLDQWKKSADGAKELEDKLSKLNSVMERLKSKAQGKDTSEEDKSDIESIIEYYSVVSSFYEQELKTFRGTDFVLTDYYDKQLKALKEQKEIEDELAKQKQEEEKRAKAELKVQEAALDVEKKRAALAEAKEKRIQVFRMGKGLVYEEDTESIANAQEDLNKSLDNYAQAQKDLTNTIGSVTENLIKEIERLEKVYAMGMIDEKGGQKLRDYFLTPENLEAYQSWSAEEQLAFLMNFLSEDNKVKAQALWGLDEATVNEAGKRVQENVFGGGTGGSKTGSHYVQEYTPSTAVVQSSKSSPWTSYEDAVKAGYGNIAGASPSEKARVKSMTNPYTNEKYKSYQEYLDAMYRKYVLKYHTGGIVGQPAFSSDNEMYAKLLKGEIVLPQTKFNDIINKVQGVTNNDSTVISIGNISLPSVTDTDSFVNELKRISYSS